jgi:hypothetical protein
VHAAVAYREITVLEHLPDRDRDADQAPPRAAWALDDHGRTLEQLRQLAGELKCSGPAPPRLCARASTRFQKVVAALRPSGSALPDACHTAECCLRREGGSPNPRSRSSS